jgi:hypothetical protein
MTNFQRLAVVTICAIFVLTAIAFQSHRTKSESVDEQPPNPNALVRLTPKRIPLSAEVSMLCIRPAPNYGPHMAAEVHIYANRRAIDYRREHPKEFDYPIGSKFMKAKYSRVDADNPDAATIMERHAANGDVTDWAFSIVSLPDKRPLDAPHEVSCAECHTSYKRTGYISDISEDAIQSYLGIR